MHANRFTCSSNCSARMSLRAPGGGGGSGETSASTRAPSRSSNKLGSMVRGERERLATFDGALAQRICIKRDTERRAQRFDYATFDAMRVEHREPKLLVV